MNYLLVTIILGVTIMISELLMWSSINSGNQCIFLHYLEDIFWLQKMNLVLIGVAQIAKAVLGQSGGFVEYVELSLFSLYDHIYIIIKPRELNLCSDIYEMS